MNPGFTLRRQWLLDDITIKCIIIFVQIDKECF